MSKVAHLLRRSAEISGAFLRLGISTALKYPLGFMSEQLRVLGPVLIYFFIAGFVKVDPVDEVGGDYFTFVMVGLVGMQTLNAGLRALSNQIDQAVTRGWFEMILVEPVPWPLLPFAMSQWPIMNAAVGASIISIVALLLGATIDPSGIGLALALSALGVLVGLAIGTLAASVKVLAKRGDPVLTFYSLGAMIFAGVYFPVDQLPSALRPLSYLFVQFYVISGLRDALLPTKGGIAGPTAGESAAVLALMSLLLVPAAVWTFGRAMEKGRRMGLLAGY